jgi:pimeloyl-ACP methyl ester carboxylesterase
LSVAARRYEKLISAISSENRDILLFDLPEISLRWTPGLEHKHVPPLQTVDTISSLVKSCVHGDQGAHVVAHSFGTVVTQWLIRLNKNETPVVSSCTLIDPVCFLLISSSVAANFCYRYERGGGAASDAAREAREAASEAPPRASSGGRVRRV